MFILALGLVLMLGVHVFASLRGPRGRVVDRIGADPYRGLHSLVAAARPRAGRVGFRALSRRRLGPDLGAAGAGARRDPDADVVRVRLARLRQQDAGEDPRLAAPPAARLGDAVVARPSHFERRRRRHAAVRRVLHLVDLRAYRAGAARRPWRGAVARLHQGRRDRPPPRDRAHGRDGPAPSLPDRRCSDQLGERRLASEGFPLSRRGGFG